MRLTTVLHGLALLGLAQSQFVTPPTDLKETKGHLGIPVRYKEVPHGTCELTPGVKSYSGYVDISEHEHIFFWFFENRNSDPTTSPLTIWINGGPGSSSMIGLFQELGPCGVDSNGELYNNPYAWNNVSNMIFIDQPATTGFSYSIPLPGYTSRNGDFIVLPDAHCPDLPAREGECATYNSPDVSLTANSTVDGAPRFWRTLQGFMGAFPQYSSHGINFATESYGGHYGPIYSEYFQQQDAAVAAGQLPGACKINLNALLIGNGWYDPLIQYASYYNFTVYPGNTYDVGYKRKIVQDLVYDAMYGPGNCYDQTVKCNTIGWNEICTTADNFCYAEVEAVYDDYLGRDEYDIRELTPDPFPYNFYVEYLNRPDVQKAIGAFVNYTDGSDVVGNSFASTGDDDREAGTVAACSQLVDQGVYVVQFYGDADYICNWLGGEVVADNVHAPGYNSAGFTNISTSDDVVHGQVKQSANFAFARIYEAGHEVPFYQPVVALEMFDRVINRRDVAVGDVHIRKGSRYKTRGTAKSTYREGNSTVQYEVLPTNATYNTDTNAPNPPAAGSSSSGSQNRLSKRNSFKPAAKKLGWMKRAYEPWM